MTRILATLDLPPRQDGGVATLVDVLATGMAEIGEPVVVYSRGRGEDISAWDERRPYPIVRMSGHSWVHHASRNFTPYIMKCYMKYGAATLVAASWQLAGTPARLAQRLGMKIVLLCYGRDVTAVETLPRAFHTADRVVALTDWLGGELEQRGVDSSRVITCLPAVRAVGPAAPAGTLRGELGLGQGPVVVAVGRLIRRKGQDRLIQAWPAVLERVGDARLLLVGEGTDRQRLERLVEDVGVAHAVRLAGFLDEARLEAAYELADLFALPCREEAGGDTEGFGLVYLEAGLRGLAVVAGRTNGVVEAVEDGKTGVLVDPDDVGEIAAALIRLLEQREWSRELGHSGQQRVNGSFLPRHYAQRVRAVLP